MEEFGEKCGIFGIFGSTDAARLTHSGLFALQHRGQESSGIAASDGGAVRVYKREGLVAHVYDEEHLKLLTGNMAIGHNRYSTSGGTGIIHAQPIVDDDGKVALAHNGNLPDISKLASFLRRKKVNFSGKNDSEMMHLSVLTLLGGGYDLETAVEKLLPFWQGAYCLLIIAGKKMAAVRDPCGIRPLALGKLNGGWVISSETCAIDTVRGQVLREIKPGEIIIFDQDGLRSHQLLTPNQKLDVFELVYFARPDSIIMGKRVYEIRKNLGRTLAKENPIKGDVVIPIPDSGIPAALGFSEVSGVPFDMGLVKNRYIHRTFIRPAQKLRENDIFLKLNPIREVIEGKDIIVIDDSIVRGTTSKKLVAFLRAAGAKKVHLLISSAPVKYPDFYGIDIADQSDLIAFKRSEAEIRDYVGADTLKYLSYPGMIKATGFPESVLCTACFTGKYPINIGKNAKFIKYDR